MSYDTLTHPVPNTAKRDLSVDLERERAVETALSMLRAAKAVQRQHEWGWPRWGIG